MYKLEDSLEYILKYIDGVLKLNEYRKRKTLKYQPWKPPEYLSCINLRTQYPTPTQPLLKGKSTPALSQF